MANPDQKKKLIDILKDFDSAMLVTQRAEGTLRGRPMQIAELQEDGSIYFITALDSPKVDELTQKPEVAVTMQGKMKWASVSGRARNSARVSHCPWCSGSWQSSTRPWVSSTNTHSSSGASVDCSRASR